MDTLTNATSTAINTVGKPAAELTRLHIEYGGVFGGTLVTKEYYVKCWEGQIRQLSGIGVTLEQDTEIARMGHSLRAMVEANSKKYITEEEALALGIPLKIKRG